MHPETILIRNISRIVTGDISNPVHEADSIYIENGYFKEIGTTKKEADLIIDASGMVVCPGFIDSHVHPVCGGYTPVQQCLDWITPYLHCGTTSMVSAGELHVPGLNVLTADARYFKYLAILSRQWYSTRFANVKLEAGTVILLPGLSEMDFDELAEFRCKNVKFIYFPYDRMDEAKQYVAWAKKRGMVVKIHSGGVSRSGVNIPADAEVIFQLSPDIVAHICGGPIPMTFQDIKEVISSRSFWIEICYCGNLTLVPKVIDLCVEAGVLDRVILGTDTPSGTGVTPRGLMRLIALIAAHSDLSPEMAICMATGNTARAHRLDTGFIQEGKPADLLILDSVPGSEGKSPLDNLHIGNLVAIALVMIDGQVIISGRTEQLPPPERQITLSWSERNKGISY
ncbi:MAG: adenosine deaminase [Deltaproteobacteria bacterium]|nr:MAG: adenosine deaminase [Deltaproteobacteria bacterium]